MILNRTKRGVALVVSGALLCLAPLSASALGISIVNVTSSGGNPNVLANGDIVTFDLRLENATNLEVQSLGVGVTGYDVGSGGIPDGVLANDHLRFVGGAVASSIFNFDTLPSGAPTGGLANLRTTAIEQGRGSPFFEPRRVSLFVGASLESSTGDGALDLGVGGTPVGSGDVHFRVQFRAVAGLSGINVTNAVTLNFGTGQYGNIAVGPGGIEFPFTNASYTMTVLPEPGTAVLIGLGLAGLATKRRL